jgi:hypothetical protein
MYSITISWSIPDKPPLVLDFDAKRDRDKLASQLTTMAGRRDHVVIDDMHGAIRTFFRTENILGFICS